ncbi:DUF4256 family protein [Kriegella sp. EG-1]|nr:DUF4256 family protein [Flavobacteriaceae bacterium EG-1]
MKKELSTQEAEELLSVLKGRFKNNMHRHENLIWEAVLEKLNSYKTKLYALNEMEKTGGEPDVVILPNDSKTIIFYDCSKESPKGRRSLCYDSEALKSRKKYKPKDSAINMANTIGVEILTNSQYIALQKVESFDAKSSSWLKTPDNIRSLGGAIFGDFRYDTVFLYHNGAESYYAARGFRASLKI